MKNKVYKTSKGCSSDEIVLVLQKLLDDLYIPDANGNYVAGTIEKAKDILQTSQSKMFGFARNIVDQMEDDEALAMLAEIDHRLTIHDTDFKFDYDVSYLGSSEEPYTLFITYGDESLGFINIRVKNTM